MFGEWREVGTEENQCRRELVGKGGG